MHGCHITGYKLKEKNTSKEIQCIAHFIALVQYIIIIYDIDFA